MKLIVGLILCILCLTNCKRYDDGPLISIRSVEKRLYKRWHLDGANVSDTVYIPDHIGSIWDITDDTIIIEEYQTHSYAYSLTADKETLIVKMFVNAINTPTGVILDTVEFKIKRLSYKHLTFETTNTPAPYKFLFTKSKD